VPKPEAYHQPHQGQSGLLSLPAQQQKDAAQSRHAPTRNADAKSTDWRHIKRQSQGRSDEECHALGD